MRPKLGAVLVTRLWLIRENLLLVRTVLERSPLDQQ